MIPRYLARGNSIPTSAATAYTAPTNTPAGSTAAAEITELLVVNTTAAGVLVTITAGGVTIFNETVPANTTGNSVVRLPLTTFLNSGDVVQWFAGGAGVAVYISGAEDLDPSRDNLLTH